MNKTRLEKFFLKNPDLLRRNLQYRFRNLEQFNIFSLSNHLEFRQGNHNIQRLNLGYLNPAFQKEKRFNRKIKHCEKNAQIKSVCLQSLDMVTKEKQDQIFDWLNKFQVPDE